MSDRSIEKSTPGTMGTFSGVFTPSILTILGIILFLRQGYVVGSAGLGRALIIMALANAISVLTSISLAAVATNIKVKVGGVYYLISRTLGVEYGGAIGIVLFLAQSVSIAFYCMGFSEAVIGILPGHYNLPLQLIAVIAVSFLLILSWLGADAATRFQYVVMGLLAAALVSFFIGGLSNWDTGNLIRNWRQPSGGSHFWVLFAIFFPAVTGFTQGVSMSGDLKDPGRSLTLGTFLAVGVSIIVYFAAGVVLGASVERDVLIHDYSAMKRVALYGFLIDAGVIAATLSSAMASFLGAPRILQSMGQDRIVPFLMPFAKGAGPANNPRRGVLLSAGIAYATISLGNLNVVAPVVSMFFLISYGLLNYATYYEARTWSPSFRPRFRWFDNRLCLLGFLGCIGTMLAIDLAAGIIAAAVLFGIYHYLKQTAGPARWADSRRSYHLQSVRTHLLAAAKEPEHPRDWRPQLIAFSNDSHRRAHLLRFASWLEGGSGLTTAARILEGEGLKMLKLRDESLAELQKDIAEQDLAAFPLVLIAPSVQLGVHTLIQSFGIGPLRVNTILLNWLEQLPKGFLGLQELRYARNLRTAFRLGCNIVVLNAGEEEWKGLEAQDPGQRRIDIWWSGDATSRLMLLLSYLMKRNDEWSQATIRVLAVRKEDDRLETMEELRTILEEVRIEAEPKIVVSADPRTVIENSADAALVFLPFRFGSNKLISTFGDNLEELMPQLPITVLVLAAEDIDLGAEPEEGEAGKIAAVLDELDDARRREQEAEKEALKTSEIAEESLKELYTSAIAGANEEEIDELEKAAIKAKEDAIKAARRAAKALAKVEQAEREAKELGADLSKTDTKSGEKKERPDDT